MEKIPKYPNPRIIFIQSSLRSITKMNYQENNPSLSNDKSIIDIIQSTYCYLTKMR